MNTLFITLLAFSTGIKLKFYLALFLVAIASNLIIGRLKGFSKSASSKEGVGNGRALTWDIIILVMSALVIKFQADFILSLIAADK